MNEDTQKQDQTAPTTTPEEQSIAASNTQVYSFGTDPKPKSHRLWMYVALAILAVVIVGIALVIALVTDKTDPPQSNTQTPVTTASGSKDTDTSTATKPPLTVTETYKANVLSVLSDVDTVIRPHLPAQLKSVQPRQVINCGIGDHACTVYLDFLESEPNSHSGVNNYGASEQLAFYELMKSTKWEAYSIENTAIKPANKVVFDKAGLAKMVYQKKYGDNAYVHISLSTDNYRLNAQFIVGNEPLPVTR